MHRRIDEVVQDGREPMRLTVRAVGAGSAVVAEAVRQASKNAYERPHAVDLVLRGGPTQRQRYATSALEAFDLSADQITVTRTSTSRLVRSR
jgi:hypothetical protein